jgi:hypothetical protein
MKNRDSFKQPYVIKQINAQPTNTHGGYADLLIDNTEKDVIIIWASCEPDPQVIHIERKHLDEFIKVLQHCKAKDTLK